MAINTLHPQNASGMPASRTVARHASLVKVWEQGILIRGDSGSGKSDLGLALVERGHQWIADDLVEFVVEDGRLHGRCPQGFSGFVTIRGLGVINIAELYGEQAMLARCPLDLVVTLGQDDECLRDIRGEWQLLGVGVPELQIPYSRCRNMPLLIETAAKMNRLRLQGSDPSADFEMAMTQAMGRENA